MFHFFGLSILCNKQMQLDNHITSFVELHDKIKSLKDTLKELRLQQQVHIDFIKDNMTSNKIIQEGFIFQKNSQLTTKVVKKRKI